MRGIGGFGGLGFASFMGAGLAAAVAGASEPYPFSPYQQRRSRRESRATGWQDRPFQHPEGETSFRPTGSKRTRRRAAARGE